MKNNACNPLTVLVFLVFGAPVWGQESWDLAGDWNPPSNPNGAWTYGDYDTNMFVNLTFDTNIGYAGSGAYVNTNAVDESDGYLYKNITSQPAFGIAPGQISLEANSGTPVARWTAPVSGYYNISVQIGGTTAIEGPGFGNNFAQFAGLNINMVPVPATSYEANVYIWSLADNWLGAGTTVDAYVAWPGYAYGGDTQTIFDVSVVAISLLTIVEVNDSVVVSWPSALTGWMLQTNDDLTTTNWANYTGSISTSNGTNSVTITPPTGSMFFRLELP